MFFLNCSEFFFFSFIRFLQLHFVDWGSMFILSDLLFYKRSFTYILYYISIEGRYSMTKVSHKSYYDQQKRSYFESWYNFQYLLKGQLSQENAIKETFYLNVFIGKRILETI